METADYYYQKLFPAKQEPPAWERYPYAVEGPYVSTYHRYKRAILGFVARLAFYLAFTAGWVYLLVRWWTETV